MNFDRELYFVIPTYRLRQVGTTVQEYDEHFWRKGAMLPLSRSTSEVMAAGCRFSGCMATLLLVRLELGRGLESAPLLAVMQITLACIVGVLIGNVVKECAFALSEGVVNGLGYAFFRTTRTLSGRVVSETHSPNGTWIRCETWKDGAAWEWTELDGSCTRVESPSLCFGAGCQLVSGTDDNA